MKLQQRRRSRRRALSRRTVSWRRRRRGTVTEGELSAFNYFTPMSLQFRLFSLQSSVLRWFMLSIRKFLFVCRSIGGETRSSTSLPATARAKCDKIGNCLHILLLLKRPPLPFVQKELDPKENSKKRNRRPQSPKTPDNSQVREVTKKIAFYYLRKFFFAQAVW